MTRRLDPPARGLLVDPPAHQWVELARTACERGEDLARWRSEARAQAWALAREAGGVDGTLDRPWSVTGHQPALVHPGIWSRFLLVDALAREADVIAVELVVDTDTGGACTLAVPRLGDKAHVVQPEIAAAVAEVDAFRPAPSAARVAAACAEAIAAARTLPHAARRVGALGRFAERAGAIAERSPSFAAWAVASRRAHERDRAPRSIVLPLSRLATTRAFRRFAALVIRDATGFAEAHARTLSQFRARERIRSRAHPVPDLRMRGDAQELPLWVLVAGRRVPLFVGPDRALVADGLAPLRLPDDLDEAANTLDDAQVHVVPRAATLTAFVRVFLADLFVHGTGGSRYEPFVDELLATALGMPGCPWAVATATLDLRDGASAVVDPVADRLLRERTWAFPLFEPAELRALVDAGRRA